MNNIFKKNYLIFKKEEPGPGFSKKPSKKPNKGPEKLNVYAQDIAEDLSREKSVEEKTEEVMQELYELFSKSSDSISKKFFKKNQSGNFIFETFLGDKMKAYVTKKLNDGFEFGEYGNEGITLSWRTPEKETVTEINPSFLDQEISDLLNKDTKKLITKAKQEILEKKFLRDIKPIYEELIRQKLLFPSFTFERFIKSDFAQDLRDVIKVNYDSQSTAYTWKITSAGVSFTPSKDVRKKGFEVIELKMEDYDSNLNYKKTVFEFLGEEGNDDYDDAQKMIDEDLENLKDLKRNQWYNETLKGYENYLDALSVKNSENSDFKKLHDELIKPLLEKIKNGIPEALKAGIPKPQIKIKIKHLVESSEMFEKLDTLSSDEATKEAAEKYKKEVEIWGKTLFEKYGLPGPGAHGHDEHGNYDE